MARKGSCNAYDEVALLPALELDAVNSHAGLDRRMIRLSEGSVEKRIEERALTIFSKISCQMG